jgi:hypothetical protein
LQYIEFQHKTFTATTKMASTLFADLQARDAQNAQSALARFTPVNSSGGGPSVLRQADQAAENKSEIWKMVGGARASDAEDLRILALTDPYSYSQHKKAAINNIQAVVEQAYISTYSQNKAAGLDDDSCKAAAKKQAMTIKDSEFKTLAIRFPNSDDIISKNQSIKTDSMIKY